MPHPDPLVTFAREDEPLREDVGLLGNVLGETLVEQGGQELFDSVEGARIEAITRRRENGPVDDLARRLSALNSQAARELVRAFSAYFSLTNLAEQVHRIRRRRDYMMTSDRPQEGSMEAVVDTLADGGLDLDQVRGIFNSTVLSPVFTAHPTQATRRTILAKEQRIARTLVDRIEHPVRTPLEDLRLAERLRTEISLTWQTDEQPSHRPTVADEAEGILFTLTDVIYKVVPAFHRAARIAFDVRWGAGASEGLEGPHLRFGSWVGGDMDGNPNVNADTIRTTLARQRELIIERYRAEVRSLFDHLSQSDARIPVASAVVDRISDYRALLSEIEVTIPRRYRDMPYRELLWFVWARLGATLEDADHAYATVDEFRHDLETIAASLAANRGAHAGLELVERLLVRVRTFGFHLATLDLRQDAEVHRSACAELIGDPNFVNQDPSVRAQRLALALKKGISPSEPASELLASTLDVFRVVHECRSRFGAESVGPYIISMAQGADDMLAVLLLARVAGLVDDGGAVPLDVAPLFETVGDLEGADATIREILADPLMRRHLQSRGDHQLVMLGYSDSSKLAGIASSRWALFVAQEGLVAACDAAGVDLTLFHGRGGTVGRGGSKPREGVLASPCGSVRGRLRVTEQGEIIHGKYGLQGIAERTLEVSAGAVVEATALCENAPDIPASWREAMQTLVAAANRRYAAFVHEDPAFVPYFRSATPIDIIERMAIGSRPPSRRSGGGVENLRAIPWVFSWTQCRHLLPGWLGVGAGIEAALLRHGEVLLQTMAQEWRFFDTLLGDVEMVLAKADMGIASVYAGLADETSSDIFPKIHAAFDQTRDLVLLLRNSSRLLEREPTLERAIQLRNPYVDPMSLIQVDLLRRWRHDGRQDRELELALFDTVRGIARGLRNTG